MLKKYLLITIIIFITLKLDAQIDKEISSFIDSTELIISNGRKLLVQSVKNNNFEKTKNIYDYLTEISLSKECDAFSFIEELYINTLLTDWEKWASLAANVKDDNRNYCYILDPQLIQVLFQQIIENIDVLLYNSNRLTEEDRKVIDIYIYFLRYGIADEIYGKKIDDFKSEYVDSKYEYFVNSILPTPNVKGSFCFTVGTNSMILTGNLADSFSPILNFSMSLDFNIDKIYMSLYFTGGDMEVQKPFTKIVDGEVVNFERGDHFDFMEYGLLGGYFLVRNNRFHFAPYVSISGSYLKSDLFKSNDDREDKEYKAFNTFVGGLGIHTELKLFDWNVKNSGYYNITKNHISLKIDLGYDFKSSQRDDMFKGNIIYFRPAIVWGMGNF